MKAISQILYKGIIILLSIFFDSYNSQGQKQSVDNLENLLRKESNTVEKVSLLNELAAQLQTIDNDKSREVGKEALILANKLRYQHGIAIAHVRIGRIFDLRSEYDSALSRYQRALKIGQRQNDQLVRAQALAHIGATYRNQSNYEDALEYLQSSLQISQQLQNSYWEAFAHNIIGLVYQQQGKYDLSLEESQKALKIRQKLGSKVDIAASLGNVGLVWDYKGNFPKALEYYFKALEMNDEIGQISGSGITWNNIGIVYSFQGESEMALEAFQKALKLHTQTGNKLRLAGTMDNIGLNYNERGLYVKALDIFQQTLKIREEIGNKTGIATSLMNIGNIYSLQNRVQRALEYYEKALSIQLEIGDQYGIANAYHSLATLNYSLEQYDKSLNQYQKALQIRQEIGNKDGIARSYTTIGSVYLMNQEYDKAKEAYQKALEVSLDIGQKSSQIYGLKGLAEAYFGLKNDQRALHYAQQALELVETTQDRPTRQNIYETLVRIYERMGQPEQAFENYRSYTILKDSILNTETSKQLTQMQVKYETEKKELVISSKDNEIRLLAEASLYRQRLTWIGGAIALLLFGFIVLYRSRKFAVRAKNLHQHYSRLLLQSQEDERKRISRDLHDSVGQSLVLIKNKILLSQDEDTVVMVSKVLEEVHSISTGLHPVMLESFGLTASIKKLVKDANELTDIFFTQEIDNINGLFSKDQELQIYRIVQESLHNMIKHAQTASALIIVGQDAKTVNLLLKDHGIGFDLTEQNGASSLGMKTLKERAQILGGKMLIESTKNKGTSISLILDKKSAKEKSG